MNSHSDALVQVSALALWAGELVGSSAPRLLPRPLLLLGVCMGGNLL